jgi:hypothetical protein
MTDRSDQDELMLELIPLDETEIAAVLARLWAVLTQ